MPKKAKMKGLGVPANVLQEFIELSYKGNTSIAPEGYSIDAPLSDSRVKVYTKNGSNDKDVIVVHRGSVGADDWIDNAKYFAFGSVKNTKTFKLHKERQLKAIEKYGANNIIGIGHSRAGLYLQALQKDYPIKEIITYNKAVGFYDMLRTNPKEQTDVKVKNDFVSLLSGLQKRPNKMVEIDATANPLDLNKAHQPAELAKLGDTFIGIKEGGGWFDFTDAQKARTKKMNEASADAWDRLTFGKKTRAKLGESIKQTLLEKAQKELGLDTAPKATEDLTGGGRPPKEKSLEELKKVLEKLLKQKEKMDKGKVYKTTNNEKINYDINYTKNRIQNYNEKGQDLIVMKIKTTSKTLEKKAEKLLKEYDEIMATKKKRGRPKKIIEEPKKEEPKKRGRPKKVKEEPVNIKMVIEPKKEEETTKEFNAIIFSLKPNMIKDIFDMLGFKVPKYTNNIDLSIRLNATFNTDEKKRQFIKTYTSIKQKEYEKQKKEEKQKEEEEKSKLIDKKLIKHDNLLKSEFKTLTRQDLANLLNKHKGEMSNDFIKELVGKGLFDVFRSPEEIAERKKIRREKIDKALGFKREGGALEMEGGGIDLLPKMLYSGFSNLPETMRIKQEARNVLDGKKIWYLPFWKPADHIYLAEAEALVKQREDELGMEALRNKMSQETGVDLNNMNNSKALALSFSSALDGLSYTPLSAPLSVVASTASQMIDSNLAGGAVAIGYTKGEGIKEQNSKILKMAKLFENINNSENGTKMVGGAMTEAELAEMNKLKALVAKTQLENEKLTNKLADALEDNETGAKRKRKVKSFDAYDILNLNKFLRTQDEVFLNPEVYEYDEDKTAFDKFLKKNPNYYREYQKKFIEDWSVSSQECVILYYGVGSGKTMIAVNCAEQFAVLNPNSSVYFLVPASLVFGTIKEMYRRGIDPNRKNDNGDYIYYFVSYQQFLNTDLVFQPNSLLIVDEIHNLRNFYTQEITEKMSSRKWKKTENFSLVGTKLGITLLQNENKFLRSIFMTGTLFVNSQYDLEPIISIGYKKTPLYKHKIDELKTLILDPQSFKQYYQGLISYYKISEDNKEFPSTKYQFEIVPYNPTEAYELTPYKAKQMLKKMKDENLEDDDIVINNEYTYKQLKEGIMNNDFEDLLNKLPEKDAYLMNSRNQSIVAKGKWIINFLKKHKKEKTIIYSQFKGYTLEPLYKIINKDFKELKYGVIDGSLSATEKKVVMDKYNTDEINVLFFTLSIKEGISFKETNNVIINEPYWNYAILEQIIARALRLDSHKKGKKSVVNIHFLVGVKEDDEYDDYINWFNEADRVMNNGIKKLLYPEKKMINKDGEEIITYEGMVGQDLYSSSPDIRLYNLMFNKQEGINRFEKLLLAQPRFEEVNDNENNDFIKTYNEALLEMPDLTNKEKIKIKRQMYKDFYEKNIKEVNMRLQRFSNDTKYKLNRNPDLTEDKIIQDINIDKDKIRKLIKEEKPLTKILETIGGINKNIITTFQANFTPQSEVELLINYSGIKEDNRTDLKILEPTAGIGNVVRGLVNMPLGANMFIDCNELHPTFFTIGQLYFEGIDNIKWSNCDFMTLNARVNYDYILGNPPFNIRTQRIVFDKKTNVAKKEDVVYHDIDFVAKAFNMLGEGGVLCMIISDRYLRDGALPKFDIFRKQLAKYLPNHEVLKIDGGFTQDKSLIKEMETSTGMVCLKLIKDDLNVFLDVNNTNFLYNRENPAEIEQYEKIKKGQLKEKKQLKKQGELLKKQIEIEKVLPKKKTNKKKEEPQNIKMIIEEPKKKSLDEVKPLKKFLEDIPINVIGEDIYYKMLKKIFKYKGEEKPLYEIDEDLINKKLIPLILSKVEKKPEKEKDVRAFLTGDEYNKMEKKKGRPKKEVQKKELTKPQNIKMVIEEKKEEPKKVDDFFKLILEIEHEDLYQILNQMGYGVPKYKNKIELNMRLASLTPQKKERFIELYNKKKMEGGKIKKKK